MRLAALLLAVGACTDDPLQPPTGDVVHYEVDEQRFPLTNAEALAVGIDLDGDDTVDNALAMVFNALAGQVADPRVNVATKLASGDVVELIDLQYASASDPDDSVAFTLVDGATRSEPLIGERASPRINLGPGTLTVSFGFYDEVAQVELVAARVGIDKVDGTELLAWIGGGLRRDEANTKLVPVFARFLQARVAQDCTILTEPATCSCVAETPPGYGGKTWLDLFDSAPKDCSISTDELVNNPLVKALFKPETFIDDEELLSFGFSIHASAR